MKLPQLVLTAVIAFVQLTGCGGGGSSSSKPTSTPSSTPTSSISVSSSFSSSSSQPITLTIQGALAPSLHLANADIRVVVGDQVFLTKSNSERTYSINMLVSDKNKFIPIQMFAKGTGAGSPVELANVLPSTIKLAHLAGNDKTVDNQEFFGTNVSTLTTAEYVQIQHLNLTLTTDSERDNALLSLSEYDAFKLASLIQYYSSQPEISLPGGKTTTLELALDKDLAEAYTNINSPTRSELDLRRDPIQTKASIERLSGKYFVKGGDQNEIYSLAFNADGTGELQANINFMLQTNATGAVKSFFTWQQEDKVIKLSFASFSLGKSKDIWLPTGEPCDTAMTDFVDTCEIMLATMHMEIITDREQGKYFYVYPKFQSFRNGELIPGEHALYARAGVLFRQYENLKFNSENIMNSDWYIDNYNYRFITTTEGYRKDSLTGAQENFVWTISNGHLSINLNNTEIIPIQETKAGYRVAYSRQTNAGGQAIQQTLMIKRQTLSLKENDWLARWAEVPIEKNRWYYDFEPNGDWNPGFYPGGNGQWSITGASSINAKSERWQHDFDALSIHDNIYYLQVCSGPAALDAQRHGCFVRPYLKTNPSSFAILGSWSFGSVFNEPATGKYVKFDTDEYYEGTAEHIGQKKMYQVVSATRLFIPETSSILELISSSSSDVILCEYPVGNTCASGSKRTLSLGVTVKLNITGNGLAYQKYLTQSGNIRIQLGEYAMLPTGHNQILDLIPSSGYSISSESISGCGGSLSELTYHIPPLKESCEININFTKNQ